jgi:cell division protein FtsN
MKKFNRPQRQESTPKKKSGGGMLLGLFLGLVIGVLIAFGVVWYMNKAQLPFQNKYEGAPKEAAPAAKADPKTAAPQPIPLAGKPGDKVGEKPRFDFYGILEGKQQATPGAVAPNAAVPPAPTSVAPAVETTKANEVFFLQAGAFQKPADADNLKARLAMSGVEANVQEAKLAEKGTMYRVRVGPLGSPDEMNRVRTQLSQNGIQATVVKQKTE